MEVKNRFLGYLQNSVMLTGTPFFYIFLNFKQKGDLTKLGVVWLLEKSLVTLVLPIFYGFLEFALENRNPLCVRSSLTISADSADEYI